MWDQVYLPNFDWCAGVRQVFGFEPYCKKAYGSVMGGMVGCRIHRLTNSARRPAWNLCKKSIFEAGPVMAARKNKVLGVGKDREDGKVCSGTYGRGLGQKC